MATMLRPAAHTGFAPATSIAPAAAPAVMPDLCNHTRGFRHSLDSATSALRRFGVPNERITIEYVGADGPPDRVAEQFPRAGTTLDVRSHIVLGVSGFGALGALPYALRDEHPGEVRSDALCALFDSPLAKLGVHLRRAGDFFTLRADVPATVLRWIEEIFGLDASPWASGRWYPIARLLPALHRVAGTTEGLSLAVPLVFGIQVMCVDVRTAVVPLPDEQRTRLGIANAKLGIDAVAGAGVVDISGVDVVLGPVTLPQYRAAVDASMRAERDALYHLLLPVRLARAVTERWVVADAGGGRIGDPGVEVALGLNSYLGTLNEARARLDA